MGCGDQQRLSPPRECPERGGGEGFCGIGPSKVQDWVAWAVLYVDPYWTPHIQVGYNLDLEAW